MDMEHWLTIRRRVLQEGVSKHQILREMGMRWEMLQKIPTHHSPPGYQRREPPRKTTR